VLSSTLKRLKNVRTLRMIMIYPWKVYKWLTAGTFINLLLSIFKIPLVLNEIAKAK
jgi:hypothetical protein